MRDFLDIWLLLLIVLGVLGALLIVGAASIMLIQWNAYVGVPVGALVFTLVFAFAVWVVERA